MKIVKPHIIFVDRLSSNAILHKLEDSARICYQSEPKGDPEKFLKTIIQRGHKSVLEHVTITFDVICDRGVSHELVRHRIASYSQESTRYVKYNNNNMEFIEPLELKDNETLYEIWKKACEDSEGAYCYMMIKGAKAQEARSVLNNSIKTQVRVTMNISSLRNFLSLRCDVAAHPHMKEIAIPILLTLRKHIPVLFDDISYDENFFNKYLNGDDNHWSNMVYHSNIL